MHHTRSLNNKLTRGPAAIIAGHGDGTRRGAVVRPVAREDLVATGLEPGHADGRLVGLGAARRKHKRIDVPGKNLRQKLGGRAKI